MVFIFSPLHLMLIYNVIIPSVSPETFNSMVPIAFFVPIILVMMTVFSEKETEALSPRIISVDIPATVRLMVNMVSIRAIHLPQTDAMEEDLWYSVIRYSTLMVYVEVFLAG